MDKKTEELMHELSRENNLEIFTSKNEIFMNMSLTSYLEKLLQVKHMKKADVIKRAGLTTVYGYQIFDGRREPKRDKVIQLAFGFGLTLKESQTLLKCAGHSELYPKVKRDVILIYGINNGLSKDEIEQLLFNMEEKGLEEL